MRKIVQITLSQSDGPKGISFRIAKLIGAICVETGNRRRLYVGDFIDERTANDLAAYRFYNVVVFGADPRR